MKQLLCSLLFVLFLFSCTNNDSPTTINNDIDSNIIVKEEKPLDETINMADFLPQGNPGTEFHYESVVRGRSSYSKDTTIMTILSMNSLTPDKLYNGIKLLMQKKSYSLTYGVEVRTDTVWYAITSSIIKRYIGYNISHYNDLYVKELEESEGIFPNTKGRSVTKGEFLFDSKKIVSIDFKSFRNVHQPHGEQSNSAGTTTYAKSIGLVYSKSSGSGMSSKFDPGYTSEMEEKLFKIVRK